MNKDFIDIKRIYMDYNAVISVQPLASKEMSRYLKRQEA